MKKIEIGKFYKVEYNTKYGKDSFIGQYIGLDESKYSVDVECLICGKDGHARIHQFNIPYDQNGIVEEMQNDIANGEYETYSIGTSCINKCEITEI